MIRKFRLTPNQATYSTMQFVHEHLERNGLVRDTRNYRRMFNKVTGLKYQDYRHLLPKLPRQML